MEPAFRLVRLFVEIVPTKLETKRPWLWARRHLRRCLQDPLAFLRARTSRASNVWIENREFGFIQLHLLIFSGLAISPRLDFQKFRCVAPFALPTIPSSLAHFFIMDAAKNAVIDAKNAVMGQSTVSVPAVVQRKSRSPASNPNARGPPAFTQAISN